MKVNFNQVILDYKKRPVKDIERDQAGNIVSETEVTYADILINFLSGSDPDESVTSKALSYKIGNKIASGKEVVTIEAKEAAHIIEKVEKHASPIVMGRIKELLK